MTAHTPDKTERPKTLGREVHEKYPAAVVGESPDLTLVEGRAPHADDARPEPGGAAREPGARDAYRDELTHIDEHGDVPWSTWGARP